MGHALIGQVLKQVIGCMLIVHACLLQRTIVIILLVKFRKHQTFNPFAGIGIGFVLLSAILVSSDYFKRRKALALGIISAGSGVGVLAIPNILRALFDHMGFAAALLLYGECDQLRRPGLIFGNNLVLLWTRCTMLS